MHPERTIRMITSRYEEALDRIKWIETGLEQLIKRYPNDKELGGRIRTFIQSLLDGEPTTADEYNESQFDYHDSDQENEYNESQKIEGIELKHEDGDTMQEDEKLVFEEQFGNNDKQHDKNAEIAEYDRKYWEEEE